MDQTGSMAGVAERSGMPDGAIGTAASKLHGAIADASASAGPAVDRMSAGAHEAVEKAAFVASDAAASVDEKAQQLMALQSRMTEQCRDYVRDHPLASIGIALAAGFVLSRLINS
ncbi:MAG: DUF883 C-terminal domain-containing protein [Betaproteobacteria bacterium]